MNRTDRLVAMVMYLQGRRLARAEDMAAHFEISVRTVYRDLSALSESGVPIVGEAGVGYSLMKSYHLPPVMLTAEEAGALFVSAELAKRLTDRSLESPLQAALLKLRAILPRDRQDYLDQLANKIVVFGRYAGQLENEECEWLLPLQEAAVRRRAIRLNYRSREQDTHTDRVVEPLGTIFHSGTWYLVAWCRLRDAMRHFRLDRIHRVDTLDETFQPRFGSSFADHVRESMGDQRLIPVRIRFAARAIERAKRESVAALGEERRCEDGALEIAMRTYSLDWLARWLLTFGEDAEALEPEILREKVREQAELIFRRYALDESAIEA